LASVLRINGSRPREFSRVDDSPLHRLDGRRVVTVGKEVRDTASIARDTESPWTPGANYGVLEAQAVAGFIDANTDTSEVIMAERSSHYALILGRGVVLMPHDEKSIRYLCQPLPNPLSGDIGART
jgi:hypothetical protein